MFSSLFKPLTKMTVTVTKVRDIVPKLREAFKVAQSGTPGPVFVELPIDVLYPYQIIKKEIISSSSSKSLVGKVVNWYLNNYLQNLFAGAFDQEWPTHPLPVDITFPKQSDITTAAEMVSKAKKPLIILGSQAVLPPVGAEKLRTAIEVNIFLTKI
jgi:acetolactate synthase-like protein